MKFLDVPQSGSWAGVTSSRNRYGQYRRTRAIPVNPNSMKQAAARSVLSFLSKSWSSLSSADQTSWSAYAALHPRNDRLGQSIVLSGQAMFVSFNQPLVYLMAQPIVITAPSGGEGESTPIPVYTPAFVGGGSAVAEVDYDPDPFAAGRIACVFFGKSQSTGVTFDNDLRFVGTILAADTSPSDFTANYLNTWGSLTAGAKVFWRIDTYTAGGPLANRISGNNYAS